jgi:hypothetical protein
VSNANAIKKRVEAALRCPSNNKISKPQSYKEGNSSQIHTNMILTYPTIH